MQCVYQSPRKRETKAPKAVVLLSGGMDSAVCAALAKSKGYEVLGLSVFYGQKHEIELKAALAVASALEIALYQLMLPAQTITGSALTDEDKEIPLNRSQEEMNEIAPSYVPARNTILIALAASFAEAKGAEIIYYGAHHEDQCGYPDCRPEFLQAMALAVRLGTAKGIDLEAPFLRESKSKIVKLAFDLGAPLQLTHSCYQGMNPACGVCDTCLARIKAFKEAGFIDPIAYKININWQGCQQFRLGR